MIGEQFDFGDEICGVVVNVRGKQERIAIWTKNASNEAAQVMTIWKFFNNVTKIFIPSHEKFICGIFAFMTLVIKLVINS